MAIILDRAPLIQEIQRLREQASPPTIAMANGLFDILHVGHLRYLEAASKEADLLLVAVNNDDSARALRGEGKPIVPGIERAELLAGLRCVDYVTLFPELSVEPLLESIRPTVHCKGTDYTEETLPEAALARQLGIRIAIVGDPKDHATTNIIQKIRSQSEST